MNKNLKSEKREERIYDILKRELKKEDDKIILNKAQYEKIEMIDKSLLDDDSIELKIQNHISRDRDVKIESRKIENFNLKLIYHRKKDSEKEYRLFISFKENGSLKRIRVINSQIKEIHKEESKMKDYFNKIKKNDIDKFLKEKIS